MSDDQQTQQAPDIREPSVARQTALESQYQANVAAGRPPYWHVHIHTRGEVQWIMHTRGWRGDVDEFNAIQLAAEDEYVTVADFRGTNFSHANLAQVNLIQADLTAANFLEANLHEAQLVDANLSEARLRQADLTAANLQNANMTRSHCRRAIFFGANLTFASLQSARLPATDLRGARLVGAHMDASTVLSEVRLNEHTQLADITWNDALLTRIDWTQVPSLGDEKFNIERSAKRGAQIVGYRNAARAYSGLADTLKSQGLTVPSARFRLRAQRLERRATLLEHNYISWLGSGILDAVAGYGERPGRAFVAYLSIVSLFAVIFWFLTNFMQTSGQSLNIGEAIVLSLSSFHGRGFFTNTIQLGDPLAYTAAFEAVTGLFIELIFIATFSRRFLGN
jgi:Pentapeptide repeats (8 copies)